MQMCINAGMAKSLDYRALTRAIMAETGENQAQLATRLKVSQPSVSRWASGKPPELHHAVLIESEAMRLGVGNLKRSRNMTSVPIVGYVGAGGAIIYENSQGPFGEAEMPPKNAGPTLVAVIVRGDSMAGVLEDGWTVYYDDRRDPPEEELYGRLCIVGLADGRVLIKRLYPGRKPHRFDLHSANAPALMDEKVTWAAKVTWIQPK